VILTLLLGRATLNVANVGLDRRVLKPRTTLSRVRRYGRPWRRNSSLRVRGRLGPRAATARTAVHCDALPRKGERLGRMSQSPSWATTRSLDSVRVRGLGLTFLAAR